MEEMSEVERRKKKIDCLKNLIKEIEDETGDLEFEYNHLCDVQDVIMEDRAKIPPRLHPEDVETYKERIAELEYHSMCINSNKKNHERLKKELQELLDLDPLK